jgi:hypothetical protein
MVFSVLKRRKKSSYLLVMSVVFGGFGEALLINNMILIFCAQRVLKLDTFISEWQGPFTSEDNWSLVQGKIPSRVFI